MRGPLERPTSGALGYRGVHRFTFPVDRSLPSRRVSCLPAERASGAFLVSGLCSGEASSPLPDAVPRFEVDIVSDASEGSLKCDNSAGDDAEVVCH